MNNTETMQMIADVFNKAGEKNHPDYKWVVVKDPYVPELIPDIHLVRKDGSSTRIDENTCMIMEKVFNSIFSSTEITAESREHLSVIVSSENGVVTIKALGDVSATTEDIEKLGAEYDKYAKKIFKPATRQTAQRLVNAINEIGKSRRGDFKYIVTERSNDNNLDITLARSPSLMDIISEPSVKVAQTMNSAIRKAVDIASISEQKLDVNLYPLSASPIIVKEGCVLTDKEIGQICHAYYKGIQELEVPTSKKITNKVMNSSIVNKLKNVRF